jgi:hypothetical protein
MPAKSPSASSTLATYIRQRISPFLMIGLGIFILFFSRPVSVFNVRSFVSFVLLIAFLFVFRLYDDLLQSRNDKGKPGRSYTEAAARKTLLYYLLAFLGLLSCVAVFISVYPAFLLFCFITINHLLYLLLINNGTASGFLPLLKYPFVYILLQFSDLSRPVIGAQHVVLAASLFSAFVAFESIEDETFPVPIKYSYVLQILSFALILVWKVNGISILSFSLLLSLSMLWTFFRMKAHPYVYLLCFLVFKIMIDEL